MNSIQNQKLILINRIRITNNECIYEYRTTTRTEQTKIKQKYINKRKNEKENPKSKHLKTKRLVFLRQFILKLLFIIINLSLSL